MLNLKQEAVLRAVLDRLIPADEFPAACEVGVDHYISQILSTDRAASAPAIAAGLDALDAEAQAQAACSFSALPAPRQDALLQAVEIAKTQTPWPLDSAAWFSDLITLAMEGFYSDPGNGGNKNEISWKMIGYDPGASRHE